MPTQNRPTFDLAEGLIAAARAAGHDADHVPNSPVDLINIWLKGNDSPKPDASVSITDDYAWGHQWEHKAPLGTPPAAIIQRIDGTATGPEAWVPEAIAEQEAYIASRKKI